MEGPSQSSQPQLCRNGCGFYGSAKTDGMCSVCYKDTLQKKNNNGRKSPAVTLPAAIKTELTNSLKEQASDSTVANAMASLATSDAPSSNSKSSSGSSTTSPTTSTPQVTTTTTTPSSPIAIPSAANPATSLTSFSPQNSSLNTSNASVDDSPSKPKKSRCASCRKRVGLTGFYCRCGKLFCGLHRYSDQHQCDFDYKADAQAKIRKENPVVVGEKIKKI